MEMSLSPDNINRTTNTPLLPPNQINFAQTKTLKVNDLIKDRNLTLRLMSATSNKEIAKQVIEISKIFMQPNKQIQLKAQTLTVAGVAGEAKSTIQLRIKFKDGSAPEVGAAGTGVPKVTEEIKQ